MLYAKKDIYALDGEVRRQIALAGQPVPKIFEKLVEKADVSESPTAPKAEKPTPAPEPEAGKADPAPEKDEVEKAEKPTRRRRKAE